VEVNFLHWIAKNSRCSGARQQAISLNRADFGWRNRWKRNPALSQAKYSVCPDLRPNRPTIDSKAFEVAHPRDSIEFLQGSQYVHCFVVAENSSQDLGADSSMGLRFKCGGWVHSQILESAQRHYGNCFVESQAWWKRDGSPTRKCHQNLT
jgi:hypothetical protein